MGDFPDYFELTNWPAYVARENKGTMTDAEMYAFLSYFDTKNLAATINCPVITSIGLQDNLCFSRRDRHRNADTNHKHMGLSRLRG